MGFKTKKLLLKKIIKCKYLHVVTQVFLLVIFTVISDAKPTCFILVKQLEQSKNIVDLNGGIWKYFEKRSKLKLFSTKAIQLESRINKIFFSLYYLCETEKGIPLNDLATYISRNLSIKSKDVFISELKLLGKTPEQINIWFKFYQFSQNNKFRTLDFLKIQYAIDQSSTLIDRYIQLFKLLSQWKSLENIVKTTQKLNDDIDKLFSEQPYLIQAMQEIAQAPYWDINESTGGS